MERFFGRRRLLSYVLGIVLNMGVIGSASAMAAYEQYQQSAKAKEFQSKIGAMFIKAHTVENLPVNITLSQKGLKKS